jgi:hypothetical protein
VNPLYTYYKGLILQKGIRILNRLNAKLQRQNRPTLPPRKLGLEQRDAKKLTFTKPYFVLSTGRCGTLWLTKLLRLSKYTYVNHSDYPDLVRHSRLAYEKYDQNPEAFQEIIRATRDDFLIRAYEYNQSYIETNNRITFFAYAIKRVYPKAKFIHLIRHPGDFVRSGLNRGWYRETQRHDLGRIKMEDPEVWNELSRTEKIGWLWNETNAYIVDFLSSIPQTDFVQVRSEDMFSDQQSVLRICRFIGARDLSTPIIDRMQPIVINAQQRSEVKEPYSNWPEDQKDQLRRYATMAELYDYKL